MGTLLIIFMYILFHSLDNKFEDKISVDLVDRFNSHQRCPKCGETLGEKVDRCPFCYTQIRGSVRIEARETEPRKIESTKIESRAEESGEKEYKRKEIKYYEPQKTNTQLLTKQKDETIYQSISRKKKLASKIVSIIVFDGVIIGMFFRSFKESKEQHKKRINAIREANAVTSALKTCPCCGELIGKDLDKCPLCYEQLDIKDEVKHKKKAKKHVSTSNKVAKADNSSKAIYRTFDSIIADKLVQGCISIGTFIGVLQELDVLSEIIIEEENK